MGAVGCGGDGFRGMGLEAVSNGTSSPGLGFGRGLQLVWELLSAGSGDCAAFPALHPTAGMIPGGWRKGKGWNS